MRTIDADALVNRIVFHTDMPSEYKEQVEDTISDMPTIEPEPQWILVSERLPDAEKKIYWVCTDSGYQCQCRWTNVNHFWTNLTTDWHWHIMDVPKYSKVIAWKSLPMYFWKNCGDKVGWCEYCGQKIDWSEWK